MQRSKAVGVNLLWLDPGVVGGSEEYTVRLLRAADDENSRVDAQSRISIRLYVAPKLLVAYPDLNERFECLTGPRSVETGFAKKGKRIAIEHSWLVGRSRHESVVHHAGGTVPFLRAATSIVTVHDLQPLEMPENFSGVKRRWLSTMIPRSVLAARTVVCPSQFTADRVVDMLGVSAGKTKVVPHGINPLENATTSPTEVELLQKRFGRFMLYPAITYPHKRHADLVDVVDRLQDAIGDLNLVLTGRDGPESDRITERVRQLRLEDRVHVLGRIPSAELNDLYHAAAVTVVPSSYEGFGNPALEAMARGCPLIVSDAAALPEVVGEAADVVPVGDIDAWAIAVTRVITDASHAEQLRRAGRLRAATYDWADAGSTLLGVYRDALVPYRRFEN